MFKSMIDRETFKAIFCNYGVDYEGGSYRESAIDDMIDNHVKSKQHIFELFGNRLKVEKEVEVCVDRDTAVRIFNEFTREVKDHSGKMLFANALLSRLSISEFLSNTIDETRMFCDVKIERGMKLSKALSKLVLPEDQHWITTAFSMVNQKTKAKGKIVISIDPIDYLTMSSNNSGWRSCHRLNGGEYRTGPIAYLNDSSSVICYVKSSKDCEFRYQGSNYTFSNKTWRQLALVSPNKQYAIQERQYPNHNSLNEMSISKLLKEVFEDYSGTEYKIVKTDNGTLNNLHVDYANQIETSYAMYYNDITNEMFEEANIVVPANARVSELQEDCDNKPVKGEAVYCVECGSSLEDADSLYCYSCRPENDEDDDW